MHVLHGRYHGAGSFIGSHGGLRSPWSMLAPVGETPETHQALVFQPVGGIGAAGGSAKIANQEWWIYSFETIFFTRLGRGESMLM